ncbi:hypothetical protein C3L33_21291, partial [Rhododendron williamsianum]
MVKQLLLKEVEKGNHENLVLSPLSIDVVLNMVASGSRGRTLEKMLGLLGSKNINEIKSQSLEMMAIATADRYLNNGDDEPVLCLVNGAWFDERYTLKPSYKEDVLEGIYGCEAKMVDFMTRMGMSFPVMENSEDFAEMVEIPKGLPLFGYMIQKACIEVDEKGTVAAAVTMMGFPTCS